MKKNKHYQAFAELVVMLIPILMIFLGIWFVMLVGEQKVRLFLESRMETETLAQYSATVKGTPHILGWDYGPDEIPFTADDRKIEGGNDESALFQGTLNAEKLNVREIAPHIKTNMQNLIVNPVFAMGAELINVEKSERMFPVEEDKRFHFVSVFRALFGNNIDQDVKENAYIPAVSRL